MIEKRDIIRLYFIEHLSTRKAAEKLGVSQCTFCRYLSKYRLTARTLSVAHHYRTKYIPRFLMDEKELRFLYLDCGLTTRQIGQMKRVTAEPIRRLLKEYGIPRRKGYRFPQAHIPWNKGRKGCFTIKATRLMSKAKKGKRLSPATEFQHGRKETLKMKIKRIRSVFRGLNKRPTRPEAILLEIIHSNDLPYAYNGSKANLIIAGRVPDFYNKNKKCLIEVFGRIFHTPPLYLRVFKKPLPSSKTYEGTLAYYAKHGYKCIIFWEDELTSPNGESIVLERLKRLEGTL